MGPSCFKHYFENFWDLLTPDCIKPNILPLCYFHSTIPTGHFMHFYHCVYPAFLLEMAGQNKPKKSLGFFTKILAFAVLALSGKAKTSDKVLKKCSVLAMSRDKQKHKKDKRKSKKQARGFLFLNMWEIEICTYTHPYLIYKPQNTPPVQPWTLRSKDTRRNVIKRAKEGRFPWVVGWKASHVTWRWDLAGIKTQKVHVWGSDCLGEDE